MSSPEQPAISNAAIVDYLSQTTANATFIQNLKIRYRPYVCPFDELLAYAEDAESVYDVGCGSGQFAALVARFTGAARIHGIEIDPKLVDNATELATPFASTKDMTFETFDGTTIPDSISTYDLVYLIDVYHHIPTSIRDNIMAQLFAKMKPGAKLMFKDIDGASPFVLCNKIHDMVFAHELSHEIGFKKARSLLERIGFTVLEARKKQVLVYPHYFILAQK